MEPVDRYTSFENLSSELKDIKESCSKLFSENWEENFEAVTELRAFIKYNWEEFQHYWTYLRPRIMQLAFSLRSFLAKNTLMLLSELFSVSRHGMLPIDILEALLNKSASEKSFLKSEILTAINNICENFKDFEIFQVILQQSFSKSVGISKVSLNLLDKFLPKLEFPAKFEILLALEDGKRQEHQQIGKKLLAEFQLTCETFQTLMQSTSDKQKKWIQSLSSKTIQKPSLKSLITQSKQQLKENCEVINE